MDVNNNEPNRGALSQRDRPRSVAFTCFDLDNDAIQQIRSIPNLVYLVYGIEEAPETGRLHIQGSGRNALCMPALSCQPISFAPLTFVSRLLPARPPMGFQLHAGVFRQRPLYSLRAGVVQR